MRIVALDLVRFFAAISVVLYHYVSRDAAQAFDSLSVITDFGYLGVPLFFMVSGYVIALSANNRTPAEFLISRVVRLYPALWVSVGFTVCVAFGLAGKPYTWSQILANLTLLNEYMGFNDIDGVYWTLKAELKFYACVFLLLVLGVFQRFTVWLSVWLALVVLYALTKQPFFLGWFITPHYSSYFIAGVALFLIQDKGKNSFNHFILLASLIVSSVKAYEQVPGFIRHADAVQRYMAVGVVWIFYGFMYCLCLGKIHLKPKAIYVSLGAITYPLYLIHNVAGTLIIDVFSQRVPESLLIVLTMILMIAVAWCIHQWIEKPLSVPLKRALRGVLCGLRPLVRRLSRG